MRWLHSSFLVGKGTRARIMHASRAHRHTRAHLRAPAHTRHARTREG